MVKFRLQRQEMYSTELEDELRDVKDFIGVFSIDKIPTVRKGKLVINLDSSNLTGSHWIAVTITGNSIIYFDPLAFPIPYLMQKFLLIHNKPIIVLTTPMQSLYSEKCGYYCIRFLKYNNPSINKNASFFTKYIH